MRMEIGVGSLERLIEVLAPRLERSEMRQSCVLQHGRDTYLLKFSHSDSPVLGAVVNAKEVFGRGYSGQGRERNDERGAGVR